MDITGLDLLVWGIFSGIIVMAFTLPPKKIRPVAATFLIIFFICTAALITENFGIQLIILLMVVILLFYTVFGFGYPELYGHEEELFYIERDKTPLEKWKENRGSETDSGGE